MRRLGEGKGTSTCLGERPAKVSQLLPGWLETGGDARGRLFAFECVTDHGVKLYNFTLTLPILPVTLLSLRAILEHLFGNFLQRLYISF